MQKTVLFDGQDVDQEALQFDIDAKVKELQRRLLDTARSFGVVLNDPAGIDNKLMPSVSGPNTILISPGSAYDGNGDYINHPGSPTDGDLTVNFLNTDVGSWIVIRYAIQQATPVPDPVTGDSHNIWRVDSATNRNSDGSYTGTYYPAYTVLITASPASTDVRLGKILSVDGLGGATLDVTPGYSSNLFASRIVYCARLAASGNGLLVGDPLQAMIDHINNFGALGHSEPGNAHGLTPSDIGVAALDITAHQKDLHSTGVVGDPTVVDPGGRLLISVTAGLPNGITFNPITPTDHVVIAGVDVKGSLNGYNISFSDGTVNAAMYQLFHNGSIVAKSVRAVYDAPVGGTGIPNIHMLDVSLAHQTGTFALHWDGTGKTLSWDSGPTVAIINNSTANTIYRLFRGTTTNNSPSEYIDIYVKATSVFGAATGTINITINASVDPENTLICGTVFWGGSADGHLGYGTDGIEGLTYDRRHFGNLAPTDLRDDLLQSIEGRFADTRSSGYSAPVGTTVVTNPSGLNVTVAPVVWYALGRKITTRATFSFTTFDNATTYIYLYQDGQITFSPASPSLFIPRYNLSAGGSPLSPPAFLIATIVAASGAVSSITMNCPNLFDLDNQVASAANAAKLHVVNVFDVAFGDYSIIPNVGLIKAGGTVSGLPWGVEQRATPTGPAGVATYWGLSQSQAVMSLLANLNSAGNWQFTGGGSFDSAQRIALSSSGLFIQFHTDVSLAAWTDTQWNSSDDVYIGPATTTLSGGSFYKYMLPYQNAKLWGAFMWDSGTSTQRTMAMPGVTVAIQGGNQTILVTWGWNFNNTTNLPYVLLINLVMKAANGDQVTMPAVPSHLGATGFTLLYADSTGTGKSIIAGSSVMITFAALAVN